MHNVIIFGVDLEENIHEQYSLYVFICFVLFYAFLESHVHSFLRKENWVSAKMLKSKYEEEMKSQRFFAESAICARKSCSALRWRITTIKTFFEGKAVKCAWLEHDLKKNFHVCYTCNIDVQWTTTFDEVVHRIRTLQYSK